MSGTFERRLRQVSVRNRLGKVNASDLNSRMDLRNKLNLTARVSDARSIIRRRVGQRKIFNRDARNLLHSKKQARGNTTVPFILPTRTVNNDRFARTQSANRKSRGRQRQSVTRQLGVANLMNIGLPVPPLDFLQGAAPNNGLFANLLPFGDIQNVVQNAVGSKISPIQGYRLEVRNLQPSVTLDDMFELFSSIGSLRLCTISRPGQADIIFNHASDALEAVERYNGRELDGRPMNVTLLTPVANAPTSELTSGTGMLARLGPGHKGNLMESRAKQLIQNSKNHMSTTPFEVDADVVRKALFNVSSGSGAHSRRPVDFSVSLR